MRIIFLVLFSLVGIARPCLSSAPPSGDQVSSGVVLYWLDGFGVSEQVAKRARSEVSRLFESAGIRTVWSDLSDASLSPMSPPEIEVILVASHPTAWGKRSNTLGFTPRRDRYAPTRRGAVFVFVRSVIDLLSRSERRTEQLRVAELGRALGRVASHEIVHALAVNEHTRHGIMAGRQSRASLVSAMCSLDDRTASDLATLVTDLHISRR